jgi:hypothetical protein
MSAYSKVYEVAIFSYGDGPALHRCLERVALLLGRYPGGAATLYAVDDGQGLAGVQDLCRASGISLMLEPRRLGKACSVASAILHAQAPVLLLVGGDGVPCLDAPKVALDALADPAVGGIGGRNVPVNADESLVAKAMTLLWELHDRVNLLKPKLGGDMVAIRVAPVTGHPLLAIDDASLEALLVKQGLRIVYRPDFFVQMRVPTTLRDAILQRRRLAAQYRQLEQDQKYQVSTRQWSKILRALLARPLPRYAPYLPLLLLIETTARLLALIDVLRGKDYLHWEPARTTKTREWKAR